MKRAWLAMVLSACLPAQTLESPCKDLPATDGGSCPSCETDTECGILSNRCYESAMCVPTAGNWAVTLIGCVDQHPPTVEQCGCVERVCQTK